MVALREDSFAGFITPGIRQHGLRQQPVGWLVMLEVVVRKGIRTATCASLTKSRRFPGVILAFPAAGSCVSDLASRHGTGKTKS